MPGPIVVGLALDDRNAAPMALGGLLARVSGGSLALVHAYPYEPLTVPLPDYEDELRDDSLAALRRAAEHLDGEFEVTVHAHARISAAYGLHDAAERLGASAVVVGSSHRGRLGRVLSGGVAARLLHGAPCPVAVAPVDYAGPDEDSLRIAVAYDGRLESREALETAVALARGGRGTVSTVTVEEPVAVATSPMPPGWVGQREHAAARHLAAEGAVAEAHDRIPDDLLGSTDLLTGHAAEILSASLPTHISAAPAATGRSGRCSSAASPRRSPIGARARCWSSRAATLRDWPAAAGAHGRWPHRGEPHFPARRSRGGPR